MSPILMDAPTATRERVIVVDNVAYAACGNGHLTRVYVGKAADAAVRAACACRSCSCTPATEVERLSWSAAVNSGLV